ncbi:MULTISPECIES: polysaccharide deacetylase family protein [Natrialbaceae]|uniref:polysaccharide deacetylase family protein n=1 Tax=Natrialbaceae TaxID=1644061 RepID=UPI00207D66DA|nr:polysaccharide deacetylase family protein [Natronococcus sp. CG52]
MKRVEEHRIAIREGGRRVLDRIFRWTGLKRQYRPAGVRCPIVLYHGVSEDPRPWDVTPTQFRRHVEWLSQTFDLLSVSQAIERWRNGTLPPRPAVITFDDGLLSTVEYALPVLEDYEVTATHYIIPGLLGEHFEGEHVMTRDDVVDLQRRDQEIGAHSMTHPDLTTVSHSRARTELDESRRILAEITGDPPHSFAYPSGAFDRNLTTVAARAGFETATTVVASDIVNFRQPFSIPRISIMRTHDLKALKSLVDGDRRWQKVLT